VDPLDLVRRYFERLESGDFVGAAECFSESARYSHPPYVEESPGSGRHEVHGREAILALFRRRGVRSTRHEITASAHGDGRFFISGVVRGSDGTVVASFVSEALFDLGRLTEYVAYSSRPPVWR
jgi:ketosteroid isomerase-like protein